MKSVKIPKVVYLNLPSDFRKFEESLKTVAEKYLSPAWEWTFKVGGKVQREIERKDPKNEGIYVIKRTLVETDIPTHDIFNLKTPREMNRKRTNMIMRWG